MGSQRKGGERTDIETLGVGLLGPWLDRGQQTWVPSIERVTACCVPPHWHPHPRGQQKPLPEHAGPAQQVAEAGASQGSQREPVGRQDVARLVLPL